MLGEFISRGLISALQISSYTVEHIIEKITSMKHRTPQETQMLTVDMAAKRLGAQPATVRAWVFRREHLEFVKVGRSVRIPKHAVERFIQTHTVPTLEEVSHGVRDRLVMAE
jgi:excisionase family DNA binding protein